MKTTKIFGPPGTGKTTTLISTLEKLLKDGYHPSEIAFVSHTKAAVEEVKHRTMQQFDGYNSRDDFKWFRTIHSCCCGLLSISYNEIIGKQDYKEFTKLTGYELSGKRLEDENDNSGERYDIVINMISYASHRMVDYHDISHEFDRLPSDWQDMLNAWNKFKHDKGKVDYTDMLEMAQGKSLPVKVMLVDECQDLSDRQLQLIQSFAANCDLLYLAGDDDQAIYEFMGSSNYGFLEFDADEVNVLELSHRCGENVGYFAEKIIRKNRKREPKNILWKDHESSVEFHRSHLFDIGWDKLQQEDTMVLFRHNVPIWTLYNHLLDRGINVAKDGVGVTNDKVSEMVAIFLRVKNGEGATSAELQKLLKHLGYNTFAAKVRKFDPKNPARLFGKEDLGEIGIWNNRMKDVFDNGKDWKVTNHFSRLEKVLQSQGVEALGKQPNINMMTYHRSKGRQAKNVVLTTDCNKLVWDGQSNKPEVERRLCYVGVTRAIERVIIVQPETRFYMRDLVEV